MPALIVLLFLFGRRRRPLPHRDPVQLDNRPVLPVPHHGGLHDLAEGGLLRRRDEQAAEGVDAHRGGGRGADAVAGAAGGGGGGGGGRVGVVCGGGRWGSLEKVGLPGSRHM